MQPQKDLPGSEDAEFTELYQRHAYTLLNFIRRYVTTHEDAEDVLLEVFIAALEQDALASMHADEQLAWLRRVAHNKSVDSYRRSLRRSSMPLEAISEQVCDDEEQNPEQLALRSEAHVWLRTHVADLSELQQEVLALRFASGLRCVEIARRLNKREGAVRMLLARSLNLLRGIYHQQEKGENDHE